MAVTRREVLTALARESDAGDEETATVDDLAAVLETEAASVATHLDALVSCDLARRDANGGVRVTVTGEELLALDVDDAVVVPPRSGGGDRSQE